MPYQLPQIALRHGGPPDARKASAHQQIQYVGRVARIRFLLAHHRRPDLCRVPDPELVSQFAEHPLEPARVSGGFNPHSHRTGQRSVKSPRFAALVLQPALDQLAGLVVQHGNLLVARMQITPYNLHVLGSFPPSLGCLSAPSLLGGWEPTRLSNQPTAVCPTLGSTETLDRNRTGDETVIDLVIEGVGAHRLPGSIDANRECGDRTGISE